MPERYTDAEIDRLANDLAGDWKRRAEKSEAEVTVWKTRIVEQGERLRSELEVVREQHGEAITALESIRDRLHPFVKGGEPAAEDAVDIYEIAHHALGGRS